MRRIGAVMAGVALALLTACGDKQPSAPTAKASSAPDLESAAIAAGVIPDPANTDLTGLYARDTDRVCVIPGRLDFRIGAYVDYGPGHSCSGSGTATRAGDLVHVRMDGAEGCEFDARYEGDRIVFPPNVPAGCAHLCTGRASLAALDVALLSNSLSEASAMRNGKGKLLCGG
ncbi:hypothetical protein ACLB0R_15805 [Sphingomonas sp. GlSt437]|uniref:hypothetical protein n=1 Tax=Sphingomonas sp. GlSt437 TaxID=3389970 RepID=UPI003A8753F7